MEHDTLLPPWDGLGIEAPPNISTREFLKLAKLDWRIVKRPLFVIDEEGKPAYPSNKVSLRRETDMFELSVVSEDWEELQNEKAADFLDLWIARGSMRLYAGGSVDDGKKVWFLVKIDRPLMIAGADLVEPFLLFTIPHEYGCSIDISLAFIRKASLSTVLMPLENGDLQISLSHRRKFNHAGFIDQTLEVAHAKIADFEAQANLLASRRYTGDDIVEFFRYIFPIGGTKKGLDLSLGARKSMSAMDSQPGADIAEGSWWQAFNAVAYTIDHEIGRAAESRLISSWYGGNKKRKEKALDTALLMAERSPLLKVA